MVKSKKVLRKRVWVLFIIGMVFIIRFFILLFDKDKEGLENDKYFDSATLDEIATKLDKLNYSADDISFIKKELSQENIDYLIHNEVDNKIAMDLIK